MPMQEKMGVLEELPFGVSLLRHPIFTVGAVLFCISIAITVIGTVQQYRRLSQFKGPLLAGISKWWLVKTVGGSRAYLDFWEVNQRYGTIARVGPNDLVTCDPDLMKRMLGTRSPYRRSNWYDGMRFNPARNNCLSWRDEEEHQELRAKMTAGYSGREVDCLEKKIDQNILQLAALLDAYVAKDKAFDFGRKAQYFTLDVISCIAYGKDFGFMSTDSDVYQYIKTTEETLPVAMLTTVLPFLVKLLNHPTFKRLLPSEKDRLGFGRVMGIVKEVAATRFGPDKKVQRDMLGSFVAHGLTQEEAESEIILQIIAGSDTTATAIRSTMLHMITNPRVLDKFRAEISSVKFDSAVIPNGTARDMPYLQSIIKEGLRIFPPVAGLMAKEAPPEGDTWKGMYIPGGTRIGYGAWGIFRNEAIFGKDPGEFRPERWLDAPVSQVREMESTLDLVFSYGRYQCLGKSVALMELNKIFVYLLDRYDMAVCDPQKPWVVKNPGIFNQSEFWIRAHHR